MVGMRSFPGNPYDGHTLRTALEQVEILTDRRPDLAVIDRGYRGPRRGKDPRTDQRHKAWADAIRTLRATDKMAYVSFEALLPLDAGAVLQWSSKIRRLRLL